jgi:hypothetical protein
MKGISPIKGEGQGAGLTIKPKDNTRKTTRLELRVGTLCALTAAIANVIFKKTKINQ